MISRAAIYVWQKDVQKYLGLKVPFSFSHLFFGLVLAQVNVSNAGTP
ncbi:MAG: hypothetical protein H7326_00730 [Bdellovibrionaceae bacterium]|nr:hypothetical protein [Pseudobdellovibrionaceae bacterium]